MTNIGTALSTSATSWDRILTSARRYARKRTDPHRYRRVKNSPYTLRKCSRCGRLKHEDGNGRVYWTGGSVGWAPGNSVLFPGRCR